MKKNIFKVVIAIVFVVGAIVSFNVEAKAYVKPSKDCPNGYTECDRVYDNGNVTIYYMK